MAVVETFQNVNPLDYLKSLDNEPGVQRMWEHFFNLARIPRSSFNEKAARQFERKQAYAKEHATPLIEETIENFAIGFPTIYEDVGNALNRLDA